LIIIAPLPSIKVSHFDKNEKIADFEPNNKKYLP